MKTFHIITAKYLEQTATKYSRIVINSARFKQRVTVSCETWRTGTHWLREHGFNVIGTGFAENRVVIVTDTFKPLRDEKQKNRSRT